MTLNNKDRQHGGKARSKKQIDSMGLYHVVKKRWYPIDHGCSVAARDELEVVSEALHSEFVQGDTVSTRNNVLVDCTKSGG